MEIKSRERDERNEPDMARDLLMLEQERSKKKCFVAELGTTRSNWFRR